MLGFTRLAEEWLRKFMYSPLAGVATRARCAGNFVRRLYILMRADSARVRAEATLEIPRVVSRTLDLPAHWPQRPLEKHEREAVASGPQALWNSFWHA